MEGGTKWVNIFSCHASTPRWARAHAHMLVPSEANKCRLQQALTRQNRFSLWSQTCTVYSIFML
jgi:hypothetical protein